MRIFSPRLTTALMLLGGALNAQAYDLPLLNLGSTSFYDGSPPPGGPGWYLNQYLSYSKADRFNDAHGNKLPLPKQQVEVFAPTTQIFYMAEPLGNGAMPGINAVLTSLAYVDMDDGLGNAALNAREGVGDLVLGPFLQLPTVMRADGSPLLTHRVEADFILPTGQYDKNKSLSPGSNYWSFDPYYAATLWITRKWSVSGRFSYLWNGKNSDAPTSFGDVSSIQAGQALHANLTTQYALTDRFSVGLNGYWLKQITDTQVDGHDVSGRREKVWAIGPGAVYSFDRENMLTANVYFEQGAQNRSEGNKFVLNFLHKL